MSIVISAICGDGTGREEVLVVHDGRLTLLSQENGAEKTQIIQEDGRKSERLSPSIFVSWAGENSRLFDCLLDALNASHQPREAVTAALIDNVRDRLQTLSAYLNRVGADQAAEGTPCNFFMLGGTENGRGKLALFSSENNFVPIVSHLCGRAGICARIQCINPEITDRAAAILREALGRPVPFEEIPARLGEVVKATAKVTPFVNDRVFVRRLSRRFELEESGGGVDK